jgi:hypothetical protein
MGNAEEVDGHVIHKVYSEYDLDVWSIAYPSIWNAHPVATQGHLIIHNWIFFLFRPENDPR